MTEPMSRDAALADIMEATDEQDAAALRDLLATRQSSENWGDAAEMAINRYFRRVRIRVLAGRGQ